jgi:hypothetical protein
VLIEILLGTGIMPCSNLDNAASYHGRPEVVRGLETIRYEFGSAAADAVRHCVSRVGLRFDPQAQHKAFTQFVILPLEDVLKLLSREESGSNGKLVLVNDWDRAVGAPKDPDFPTALAEETYGLSPVTDAAVLSIFIEYIVAMHTSCASVPRLDAALSEQGMPSYP